MFYKSFPKTILIYLVLMHVSCKQDRKTNQDRNQKMHELHKIILKVPKDSIYYYLKQTNELLTKNSPDSLKAENTYLNGYYHYYVTKKIDTAFKYYNLALTFSKDSLKRKRELNYFMNLAEKYLEQGDELNGISTVNTFQGILDKKKHFKELDRICNYKKRVYSELGDYKKALFYNKKSLAITSKNIDKTNYIIALIDDAVLNYRLNNKKQTYHTLDSLIASNFTSEYDYYIKNRIHSNYGDFNANDNNLVGAKKQYLKAIFHIKKSPANKNLKEIANSYNNLFAVLVSLKEFGLAKQYKDSVQLYNKYLSVPQKKQFFVNQLNLTFLTTKNFNLVEKEIDSVYTFLNQTELNRINNKLVVLEESYKQEKKLLITNQAVEISNQNLKKNQYILFSLLGFSVLISLIGILFYKQQRIQASKNAIFLQQRLFRAQMNPHFTSNILYSIQNLIKENTEIANSYLIKFSRLLRLTLENSLHDYVEIDKEIEVLNKYLDLQKMRFPNKFEYTINTVNLPEDSGIKIPPMLFQPFVENTIEHGFKNIKYKGEIIILLQVEKKFINCNISDNGVGSLQKEGGNSNSISTQLIHDVLKEMTKQDTKIKNKKLPNKGIMVSFNIPYKL